MRRPLIVVFACLLVILTVAASAAPAKRFQAECTWGASSVVVEEVNGQLVQSEPAVSGCIP